jgi:hypothetical protein
VTVRRPLLAAALLATLALALARAPASAAEGTPDAAVEAELRSLERPPPAASVVRIVRRDAVARDRVTALRVVGVLWHSGGRGAAVGLGMLARHADAEVRATALRGVARLGLRIGTQLDGLREATLDREGAVRDAALAAIGRVGDGDDVEGLLAWTETEDLSVRHVAFRALATLSGQRIARDPRRWRDWWADASAAGPARIEWALGEIERPDGDVGSARAALARHGWQRLPVVLEACRGWLRSPDPRLREEGYRLAGALRMADLADEVSSAFRYEADPDAWRAGRWTAALFGTDAGRVASPRGAVSEGPGDGRVERR